MAKIILYIDDHRLSLLVIQEFFNDTEYQIVISQESDKWQDLMVAHQPDILLLDLDMPVSGEYIAEQVRLVDKTIPMVAYSAKHVAYVDVLRAIGFNGLITKIKDKASFLDVFTRILGDEDIWETIF